MVLVVVVPILVELILILTLIQDPILVNLVL